MQGTCAAGNRADVTCACVPMLAIATDWTGWLERAFARMRLECATLRCASTLGAF